MSWWTECVVLAWLAVGQTAAVVPATPVASAARVAVLDEPQLPVAGQPSDPAVIAGILADAGLHVERLSAAALADPAVFCRERFEVVVLPGGETFPVEARASLIDFLRQGGDLVTMGGYAFQNLVRHVDGQWVREQDFVAAKRRDATRDERSLLLDGGFENAAEIPLGTEELDGRWRRSSDCLTVTDESPYRGRQCVRVSLDEETATGSGGFHARVRVAPGRRYQVTGALRATRLAGPGVAYLAVYQFDAQGNMVDFRDFASVREPCDWQAFEYQFVPTARVDHVRVQGGFYMKNGEAYFDELRLFDVTEATYPALNTATGEPGDGLKVTPEQIGIFDPSFPLRRVASAHTAAGQLVAQTSVEQHQAWTGWAASGVIGVDQARWIPLLDTRDRYGRHRGPAAALVLHYDGHYAGSGWLCFGVDNVDLFADGRSETARLLQQSVQFLTRKVFLRQLQTNFALYHAGEHVEARVTVDNRGPVDQPVTVQFQREPQPSLPSPAPPAITRVVGAGQAETFRADLGPLPALPSPGLAGITARLAIGDTAIDQLTTGVVLHDETVVREGPHLRFADNYFTLNAQPLFLFGSDDYAVTYQSASENPATWLAMLNAARDMGVQLYENLQYHRPEYQVHESDWRRFRAMTQLCQSRGLVFMPGMLIGQNTAVRPELLTAQSRLCAEYARRLSDVPGLLYYINGDYHLDVARHPEAMRQAWSEWLASQYASVDEVRQAWAVAELDAVRGFDEIPYPPVNYGRWEDRARIDDARFRTHLTRRWNQAHVAALRAIDTVHPITSEYYQQPSEGIDLPLTIETQDVSNIGYFDLPGRDIEQLPWKIGFADLRARGQGVSLGEYGVKTHPAWEESNGGWGYHIRRSEDEQRRLFVAVAHYALGLGCSKIQHWCLRDAHTNVFPWGIFYPHQMVPKDVAYVHRNQSLAWRCLRPRYEAPAVLVVLANQLRLGNDARAGVTVADHTCADLLALHVPFACLDDDHLDAIPAASRLLIYPCPFALSDATYQRLLGWVQQGGALLLTGDISFDQDRQPTRTDRLLELAGVRARTRHYANIQRDAGIDRHAHCALGHAWEGVVRPCLTLDTPTAEVLGRDDQGDPILVRHRVGQGTVYFSPDPSELAGTDTAVAWRRNLYRAVVQDCGIAPLQVEPDLPTLHVLAQPTQQGTAQVVFNTAPHGDWQPVEISTTAGQVQLETRGGWPALAVTSHPRKTVMVHTCGKAAVDGQLICRADGQQMLVALDGADLRQSRAMLLAPLSPGAVTLPAREGEFVALVGDFAEGTWHTAETIPLQDTPWYIEIDPDRATLLTLICPATEQARWTHQLETLLRSPERVKVEGAGGEQ